MSATGELAEGTAAGPGPEGRAEGGPAAALDLVAPLGGLFAQVAAARWAPIFGGGGVEFSGLAAGVEAGAVVGAAAISAGGEEGWLRAALQPGAGAGGEEDARAVSAWLEGIGAAVGRLLGSPADVRPAAAGGEDGAPDVPDGTPVLGYAVRMGRRAVRAWCWLDDALLARCLEALGAGAEEVPPAPRADPFPPLPESEPPAPGQGLDVLLDVPVQVAVELGRTERQIREVLALVPGSVVELDRLAGDPLDLLVNGRRIARGEAVVVDERFAIRITEILGPEERGEAE